MRQTQNKDTRELKNAYERWKRSTKSELSFFEWKEQNGLSGECTKLCIDV